jgi:hypothetical protein
MFVFKKNEADKNAVKAAQVSIKLTSFLLVLSTLDAHMTTFSTLFSRHIETLQQQPLSCFYFSPLFELPQPSLK